MQKINAQRATARAQLADLIARVGERAMSSEETQLMTDLQATGERLGSLANRYAILEKFDQPATQPIIRHPLIASPADDKATKLAALDSFFRTGILAADVPLQIQQSPLSGASAAVPTDVASQIIEGVPVIDVPAQLGVTEYPRESTNPLVITILGGAPAAATFNEAAAPTESTPGTYKTKTLTGKRTQNLTKVSVEAIANVGFPLVPSVVRALTIGQIQSQNTAFATALKAACQANSNCLKSNTSGTQDAHTLLSKLITGLPALWQNLPGNTFLLSSADLLKCMDARDQQLRPLLDLNSNKLMGKPYVVCDDVDRLYYGNFQLGAMRSRSPLYVQVLRELFAQAAMVGYTSYQFSDFGFYAELTTLTMQPVVFTNTAAAGA